MKALPLVLLLTACASPYLTKDEEADMRKACGPEHDCVVISGNTWRQIKQFIAAHRGQAI